MSEVLIGTIFFGIITTMFALLIPALHLFLAIGVLGDSSQRTLDSQHLRFLWPTGWALLTLVFGIFGAFAYWLFHHSSLDAQALSTRFEDFEGRLQVRKIGAGVAKPSRPLQSSVSGRKPTPPKGNAPR